MFEVSNDLIHWRPSKHGTLGGCKAAGWSFAREVVCGQSSTPVDLYNPPPAAIDVVNKPKHYTFGKYEVIDVIEDWQLPYHLGAVVKYVARAGRKDPAKKIEDLEKASWYLTRYIQKEKSK